jgi:2-polyprenyl-3-methyl-5-hydroxy-6-metoxy-1,4-benzoquinol methylase
MADAWWQTFFDGEYLRIWSADRPESQTAQEVEFLARALALAPGMKVLDAPCGYGRLSRPLAERGLDVVGVDQAQPLVEEAERTRGQIPEARLRYLCHDLRQPLALEGMDAAFDVFSSIGYGEEDDDLAVFRTLRAAVRPGGKVLIETVHRDAWAAQLSRDPRHVSHLPDGTLFLQEISFDALTGRAAITYSWQGPGGGGQKASSVRIYAVTELARLLEQAGLPVIRALQSPTGTPFEAKGSSMGGKVALLCERP